MNHQEATDLLRAALPGGVRGTWADLGAGTGVFTRALASILGPAGRVIAVDADERALATLRTRSAGARVTTLHADFARPLALPPLDGVLLANALHFSPDPAPVLALVAGYLRPGGRLVLVEYDHRRANPWVPYPVSSARFRELAPAAGFTRPEVLATRPSVYGGELYVAVAERRPPPPG